MIRRAEDIPWSELHPVGAGHYNDVYEFSKGGEEYVLRIAPSDDTPKLFYEVDMMQAEPMIHAEVSANTNIPVPEVVFYDFSREHLDRDYILLKKMAGREGGYDLKELGQYVAQLHSLQHDAFGYPRRPFSMGKDWQNVFLDYVERIFDDCVSVDAVTDRERDFFLETYYTNKSVLQDCTPCLLHLDLWQTNILTQNGRISGILDFDRGMYGDVELEFAVLDTYASATDRFFQGYGAVRPNSREAGIRRVLYLVYELIKYAFIRLARNSSQSISRMNVNQCLSLIKKLTS